MQARLALHFLMIASLGGCTSLLPGVGRRDPKAFVCAHSLPGLLESLDSAVLALAAEAGRRPASAAELDKRGWQRWSERHLITLQDTLDAAGEAPQLEPMRAELSALANAMVAFHGYCEQGKLDRMISTLRSVQGTTLRLKRERCARDRG
jgi:hypothetical protein